jgi:predicted methyltransferase
MTRTTGHYALATILALTLIAGCGEKATEKTAAEPAAPAPAAAAQITIYEAALAHPSRPAADRQSDIGRKPGEVLEFMGIEPGMTVLDMFSGGGWYAEVIAHVVGENGHVIAHSNEAYKSFVGDALAERFDGVRVPNVEILMAENNQLSLAENSLDAVMLAQSFHDLYHSEPEGGWELIDGPAFLAELKKGLKPGGIVAIIDHTALEGAPPETGDSLHRIDPGLVIANMEAAGFVLEARSDILNNPDDDLTQTVFAEGIRGKTSRFAMRFRNPR